jgi:hypothetical protein
MKINRLLAFVLCFVLFVSLCPVSSIAVTTDEVKSGYKSNNSITSQDGLWEYKKGAIYEYYGKEKNITLPTEIDGQPMNAVCFIENNNVESIYIPSNYTTFIAGCFCGLQNLKTVEFAQDYSPFQVKRFDDALFLDCPKLEKVVLPNDMECGSHYNQALDEYISGGALPNDLFYNCKSLKEVTFPDNLTQVGSGTFEGCTSIEKIVVPDGVLAIGVGAFKDTPSLKTLVLPDSIGKGGLNGAFNGVNKDLNVVCSPGSRADSKIEYLNKWSPEDYSIASISSTPSDVKGDINRDKKFNINDVTHFQKYIAKDLDILCVNEPMLDFNGDGKINIIDATAMQKALAKIN